MRFFFYFFFNVPVVSHIYVAKFLNKITTWESFKKDDD